MAQFLVFHQKLNFGIISQNTRKSKYPTFFVLFIFTGFLYFVLNILSGIVVNISQYTVLEIEIEHHLNFAKSISIISRLNFSQIIRSKYYLIHKIIFFSINVFLNAITREYIIISESNFVPDINKQVFSSNSQNVFMLGIHSIKFKVSVSFCMNFWKVLGLFDLQFFGGAICLLFMKS